MHDLMRGARDCCFSGQFTLGMPDGQFCVSLLICYH